MKTRNIIILGLLIAVLELVIGVVYLKQSGRKTVIEPYKQPLQVESSKSAEVQRVTANLALSSDKTSVKVGQTVLVTVKLNISNGESSASDLTIKYDPGYLSPIASASKPFKNGELYEKIVFNAADFKNGVATMSAVSAAFDQVSGEGVLATISFKALKEGQTDVKVVFSPGNTTDSNVVVDAKDVLESTTDLSLQIAL